MGIDAKSDLPAVDQRKELINSAEFFTKDNRNSIASMTQPGGSFSQEATAMLNGLALFDAKSSLNSQSDAKAAQRVADASSTGSSLFSGWWPFSGASEQTAEPKINSDSCSMTRPRMGLGFLNYYSVSCSSGDTGEVTQSFFPFLNSFTLSLKDPKTGNEVPVAQSSRSLSLFGPTTFRVSGQKGETIAYINRETEAASGKAGDSKPSTVYTIKDSQNKVIAKTSRIPYGQDSFQIMSGDKELASSGQGWLSNRIPLVMPEYYSVDVKANNNLHPYVLMILQALHARQAAKQK